MRPHWKPAEPGVDVAVGEISGVTVGVTFTLPPDIILKV